MTRPQDTAIPPHNINHYVTHGFVQKYGINRLTIRQTSENIYDITLKPRMWVIDLFPSFYHIEIRAEDGRPVAITAHRHMVLYGVLIAVILFFSLNGVALRDVALKNISFLPAFILLKIYGYYRLKKIGDNLLNGRVL